MSNMTGSTCGKDLHTLLEHLSSTTVFGWVGVAQILVFDVVFFFIIYCYLSFCRFPLPKHCQFEFEYHCTIIRISSKHSSKTNICINTCTSQLSPAKVFHTCKEALTTSSTGAGHCRTYVQFVAF